MNEKELASLRRFMKKQHTFNIYNIMGVMRGNDHDSQWIFKKITKAIRQYIGLNGRSCSGELVVSSEELKTALKKLDQYDGDKKHYVHHLRWAVESIGRENLIKFIEDYGR